jgi:hypothetical protein
MSDEIYCNVHDGRRSTDPQSTRERIRFNLIHKRIQAVRLCYDEQFRVARLFGPPIRVGTNSTVTPRVPAQETSHS